MAKHVGEKFADQRVVLDEDEFYECTFTRCQLVYQGGERAYIVGCRMEQCRFDFEGSAGRTLLFLQAMYRHMGPAGERLVEQTLEAIRQPDPEAEDDDPGIPPRPGHTRVSEQPGSPAEGEEPPAG